MVVKKVGAKYWFLKSLRVHLFWEYCLSYFLVQHNVIFQRSSLKCVNFEKKNLVYLLHVRTFEIKKVIYKNCVKINKANMTRIKWELIYGLETELRYWTKTFFCHKSFVSNSSAPKSTISIVIPLKWISNQNLWYVNLN